MLASTSVVQHFYVHYNVWYCCYGNANVSGNFFPPSIYHWSVFLFNTFYFPKYFLSPFLILPLLKIFSFAYTFCIFSSVYFVFLSLISWKTLFYLNIIQSSCLISWQTFYFLSFYQSSVWTFFFALALRFPCSVFLQHPAHCLVSFHMSGPVYWLITDPCSLLGTYKVCPFGHVIKKCMCRETRGYIT